jgi:hypothetical protein
LPVDLQDVLILHVHVALYVVHDLTLSNPIALVFGRELPAASPYTHHTSQKEQIAWAVPAEAGNGIGVLHM